MISFRKLRAGDWGLHGTDLIAGEEAVVTLKDKSTKKVRVGKILWTNGVESIATLKTTANPIDEIKTCWDCGCKFTLKEVALSGNWEESYCGRCEI